MKQNELQPVAVQQHAQPNLSDVICWVENGDGALCQAVEKANKIEDIDNAFVRLSAVLLLLKADRQHPQAAHRPGCDALGGYGHGVGPCSCGKQHAQAVLSDDRIIEIAVNTRTAEANKDGGYMLPISFARAILAASQQPAAAPAAPSLQVQEREVIDERAAFEKWIGLNSPFGPYAERYEDTYTDNYVGEMWESWQARAALAAPAPVQPAAQQGDGELRDMEARKDAAYWERSQVVAALAKCFPSGLSHTAIEGWSEDWHGCVYIDLPTGQASWHFHDSQSYLFEGIPTYPGKWDGHDTEEKYRRLASLAQRTLSGEAKPVSSALHVAAINALFSVATAAFDAMDNSEERANAAGGEDAEYIIQGNDFTALSTAMDEIDALPDDRPGYTLSGGARAGWALRGLFTVQAAQPDSERDAALSPKQLDTLRFAAEMLEGCECEDTAGDLRDIIAAMAAQQGEKGGV